MLVLVISPGSKHDRKTGNLIQADDEGVYLQFDEDVSFFPYSQIEY